MPELSEGLFETMRRIDGARFRGHLTTSLAVTTKEKAPYRVLYARRPTFLAAGDIVLTRGGEVVLLLEHPDDFNWAKSFKAAYALEQYPWSRPMAVVDPVSGVERGHRDTSMGTLYASLDTPEELRFMGFLDTEYRFLTGQDVQVGDKIGDFRVKRIVHSLGVKVVFAA